MGLTAELANPALDAAMVAQVVSQAHDYVAVERGRSGSIRDPGYPGKIPGNPGEGSGDDACADAMPVLAAVVGAIGMQNLQALLADLAADASSGGVVRAPTGTVLNEY
eukprot:5265103-Pyramimonas_sp.AAC.1